MSVSAADRLSATQIRLRTRHPFFATLALFAEIEIDAQRIDTAATDGRTLYFNPDFLARLDRAELDGLLTHEVLHAALRHPHRRGMREATRWNIACDIVVNGMIAQARLTLPPDAIREAAWEHLSAEEIYERLLSECSSEHSQNSPSLPMADLLPIPGPEANPGHAREQADLDAHWQLARDQARVVYERLAESGKMAGDLPWGASRDWQRAGSPEIDWRTILWRFLVRTPVDFTDFDRRFIGRGLYLETLAGESVRVAVCIDTSASIDDATLGQFQAELLGILGAFRISPANSTTPMLTCMALTISTPGPTCRPPKAVAAPVSGPFSRRWTRPSNKAIP